MGFLHIEGYKNVNVLYCCDNKLLVSYQYYLMFTIWKEIYKDILERK